MILDGYLVLVGPCRPFVGGIAHGDVGSRMVMAGVAVVAGIRKHDASVPERHKRTFAVAWVVRASRQLKRDFHTLRGIGESGGRAAD